METIVVGLPCGHDLTIMRLGQHIPSLLPSKFLLTAFDNKVYQHDSLRCWA